MLVPAVLLLLICIRRMMFIALLARAPLYLQAICMHFATWHNYFLGSMSLFVYSFTDYYKWFGFTKMKCFIAKCFKSYLQSMCYKQSWYICNTIGDFNMHRDIGTGKVCCNGDDASPQRHNVDISVASLVELTLFSHFKLCLRDPSLLRR